MHANMQIYQNCIIEITREYGLFIQSVILKAKKKWKCLNETFPCQGKLFEKEMKLDSAVAGCCFLLIFFFHSSPLFCSHKSWKKLNTISQSQQTGLGSLGGERKETHMGIGQIDFYRKGGGQLQRLHFKSAPTERHSWARRGREKTCFSESGG